MAACGFLEIALTEDCGLQGDCHDRIHAFTQAFHGAEQRHAGSSAMAGKLRGAADIFCKFGDMGFLLGVIYIYIYIYIYILYMLYTYI